MTTSWQQYLAWNAEAAESLFPVIDERRMVFLDLEGDALHRIARRRDCETEDVVRGVAAAVRKTLDTSTQKSLFERFDRATERWSRGDRLEAPPAVALLSLFALAAGRMQRGGGLSDQNYYGQLALLLAVDDTESVSQSFRRSSPALWESLSVWLTQNDGLRGDPVGFSVGHHEYIGRAKAQALVRDTDRRRLTSFFLAFDLAPHSDMTSLQLRPLLDGWLMHATAPRHLSHLWQEEELQGPLIEAVRSVLSGWDGSFSGSSESHRADVRLTLASRSGLRKGVSIGLSLRLPHSEEGREAVLHAVGGDVPVGLVPMRPGEMRIPDLKNLLSPEQLVSGLVSFTDHIAGGISRSPRSVVVLRRDDASADWLEVAQVRLGDDIAIITQATTHLDDVLAEISGTAWTEDSAESLPGMPVGWKLIRGVTVIARPTRDVDPFSDLHALVPITHTAFAPTGGLRLPAADRSWRFHARNPPALTISHEADTATVRLFDLEGDHPSQLEELGRSEQGRPIVVDLADFELDAGHYGITVTSGRGSVIERELWLHDSSLGVPSLIAGATYHVTDDPLWAISADVSPTRPEVQGLPLVDLTASSTLEVLNPHAPPTAPWWRRERTYERGQRLTVPVPEPDSCVFTGKHHEDVETASRDATGTARGSSLGVCRYCGRTKRYVNSYWKNHRRWERARSEGAVVEQRKLVQQQSRALGTALDWNLLLDAALSVGGGRSHDLRRVTQQFDPSARFFHEVVSTLSDLGHIEISRDPGTGEVEHWETSATAVAEIGAERVLVGHWSHDLVADLDEDGLIVREKQTDAPDRVHTTASPDELASYESDLVISLSPAAALLGALPTLQSVIEALPRTPMPSSLTLDRYESTQDVWHTTRRSDMPGAYRTGGYSRTYVVRTDDDVRDGSARVVNVALAKHAVAVVQEAARPLISYSPVDRELVVPLGARLPDMYSRAMTLASGWAPRRRDVDACGSFIVYSAVSADLAGQLYAKLGG